MLRRLRWDWSVPDIGQVLDDCPNDGYATVEAIEDDPDAVWEMSAFDPILPEYRPKTHIVVLRPSTASEIAEAQRQSREYAKEHEPKRGFLERLRFG